MGIVYEAEQLSMERTVALKVIPFASVLDMKQLARFKNEARAAGILDHPNIVHVYSVGCERGVHYYAMQYVCGRSLAEVIDELRDNSSSDAAVGHTARQRQNDSAYAAGDLRACCSEEKGRDGTETATFAKLLTRASRTRADYSRWAADSIAQAAMAVHYAHEMGVVHRDIKPANLLVNADGHVWVTDFGLATPLGETNLTASGDLVGTIRYMSPEQASGDRAAVSHLTDVYSLGITLYELVCLRPAFDAENRPRLLRDVVEECPARPRLVSAAIPKDLENIILRAIEKEPLDRYTSAAALADDLQRYLAHQPVRARQPGRLVAVKRWTRRNPLAATLAMCVLTLICVSGIAGAWAGLKIHESHGELERSHETLRLQLYVADMNRANAALGGGDNVRTEDLLLRHVPDPPDADPRGFEWYYLWKQCHRDAPDRVLNHGLSVYGVDVSPDGTTMATSDWSGRVRIWDLTTGDILRLFSAHARWATCVRFLGDGQHLVTAGHGGQLKLWDLHANSNIPVRTLDIGQADKTVHAISISRDERLVALTVGGFGTTTETAQPSDVVVWDIVREIEVSRFTELPGETALNFSPDGKWLVAGSFDGQVRIWDTKNWLLAHTILAHQAAIRSIVFSRDGQTLVTGSGISQKDKFIAGQIGLWDADTWTLRRMLHCASHLIDCLAMSPTQSILAAGSFDGSLSLFNLQAGDLIRTVPAHSGRIFDLAFSSDGQRLCSASTDNKARAWSISKLLRSRRPLDSYTQHRAPIYDVDFTNSGNVVCSSDWDGNVRVWDAVTGRLIDED